MHLASCWVLLGVCVLLVGCFGGGDPSSSYSISIRTSAQLTPNGFAGSYQFFRAGERITRDLSADGTHSVNFEADRLVFVRVHGNDAGSIYSLSVVKDRDILYESAAIPANQPLIFHVPPTE
ncbi:MAG: hypothetical protein AB8G16_12500 [Gammaproteobacteria bacterium]